MVTLLLKVYLCWPSCPRASLLDWVLEYPSSNIRSSSPAIFFDILDLLPSDLCLSGVLEFSLLPILAIWLLSFVLFPGFLFDVLRELCMKEKVKKLTSVSFMYVCVAENAELLVFFYFFLHLPHRQFSFIDLCLSSKMYWTFNCSWDNVMKCNVF